MSDAHPVHSPIQDPKLRREEKLRRRKLERQVRRRQRAGRAAGESASVRQLAREYWRAGVLRVGKNYRKRLNAILARYSEVGDPPVFDTDQFRFVRELEANWETIRAEAQAVMEARDHLPALHEISPDHDRISNDGTWKAFFLRGYGVRRKMGCRQCPETARLVESIPNLWSAFFSILTPGSHLIPHRGPTKAIITWHLGLLVPKAQDQCWIRVSDQVLHWQEGKSLVFDDACKHEVRNDSDEPRVVLLLHFRRPLRFPGSLLGKAILTAIRWSPFIQDAKRNHDAWERAFEAATAERVGAGPTA